jgi:hypothetical protein
MVTVVGKLRGRLTSSHKDLVPDSDPNENKYRDQIFCGYLLLVLLLLSMLRSCFTMRRSRREEICVSLLNICLEFQIFFLSVS